MSAARARLHENGLACLHRHALRVGAVGHHRDHAVAGLAIRDGSPHLADDAVAEDGGRAREVVDGGFHGRASRYPAAAPGIRARPEIRADPHPRRHSIRSAVVR